MSCFLQQLLKLASLPTVLRTPGSQALASGCCLHLAHPGNIPWFAERQACGNAVAELSLLALEASLVWAGGICSSLQGGKADISLPLLSVSVASSPYPPWKSCFNPDICNLPRELSWNQRGVRQEKMSADKSNPVGYGNLQ